VQVIENCTILDVEISVPVNFARASGFGLKNEMEFAYIFSGKTMS